MKHTIDSAENDTTSWLEMTAIATLAQQYWVISEKKLSNKKHAPHSSEHKIYLQ